MLLYAHNFSSTGFGRVARQCKAAFPGIQLCNSDRNADLSVYPLQHVSKARALFTMHESNKIPKVYVKGLNSCKLIIVPTKFDQLSFMNSGVLSRVEVCNLSVVPHYSLPANFDKFTFLHIANDSGIPERKRSQDIVDSFSKAFPDNPNVRLIVKKNESCKRIVTFDKRIIVIYNELTQDQMVTLFKSCHVGIFLSGMESWGYPHLDLMSVGRPVIAPFYGGPAEYLDASCGYAIDYTLVATPLKYYQKLGKCAFASTKHLIKLMQFCVENKEDTILKGVHAYRKSLGYTHSRMAATLHNLLLQ
jgi:glycosyltransferase involved in cell wall biosynthesis